MPVIQDTFDRANTGTGGGLGITSDGQATWQIIKGSWEILSNKAHSPTVRSDNPIATIEAGVGQLDASLNVSHLGGDCLYFRVVDANNWWRVRIRHSTTTIYCTEYEYIYDYGTDKGALTESGCLNGADTHGHADGGTTWCSSNACCKADAYIHTHTVYNPTSCIAASSNHDHHRFKCDWTGNTRQVACGTDHDYFTYLEKCVGGTVTQVASYGDDTINLIRVRAVDANIKVYLDGTLRFDKSDTTHQAANKHGVGRGTSEETGSALDNWNLDPLNISPNTPINVQRVGPGTDITPNFSADISDPDSTQQIKARFELYQNDGVTVIGTVDSVFRTGAGTATAEYATGLPIGQYKVRAKTIDDQGLESAWTAFVNFNVAFDVQQESTYLWNTQVFVSDDSSYLWDLQANNIVEGKFRWSVQQLTPEKDVRIRWKMKTVWVPVDDVAGTWRRVSG